MLPQSHRKAAIRRRQQGVEVQGWERMTRRAFLMRAAGVAVGGGVMLLLSCQSNGPAPVAPASVRSVAGKPSATPEPTTAPANAARPTDTAAPTDVPQPPATATAQAASAGGKVLSLAQGVTLDLVDVPTGRFWMGSRNTFAPAQNCEKPQTRQSLTEYWIGKYDVTNAQFLAFVRATGYKTSADQLGSAWAYDAGEWRDTPGANWLHPRGPGSDVAGKDNHPVVQVSWDDAMAFCVWASQVTGRQVQLPTEAQWEKAARGTDGRLYPWGNEQPDKTRANFNLHVGDTTPVGKYSPAGDSPCGAADMAGNVLQWTHSLRKPYPYRTRDGREDEQSRGVRALRGGCYMSCANGVRCAYRNWSAPVSRYDFSYGFRVVADSA